MDSADPDTQGAGPAVGPMDTLDLSDEVTARVAAMPHTLDSVTSFSDSGTGAHGFSMVRPVSGTLDTAATQQEPAGDDSASSKPDAPSYSQRLGRYERLTELGRGGMGIIYEGYDPSLGRTVAIKVMLPEKALKPASVERFVAEARLTSQLEHPNIVPVHDFGVDEHGRAFYAMKKVEGESLRAILDRLVADDPETSARWTRHRLLRAFIQMCHGLAYAHERDVVHRDLKPANIMIGRFGEVLVMDWGLGRIYADGVEQPSESLGSESFMGVERSSTQDGAVKGTPGYMSPEQVEGRMSELSPTSDVFCLGIILYELLTHRPPYTGRRPISLLVAATRPLQFTPRERAPTLRIPEEIEAICLKALSLRPEDRYAGAAELAEAVEAHLEGSKRRERAAAEVDEGEGLWLEHRFLSQEQSALIERERELAAAVEPWAPRSEKAELLGVRERLELLATERATVFGKVIAAGERALTHDPGNPAARELLAWAYWARFEEAEAQRDAADQAYFLDRCRAFNDGPLDALLADTGLLTLRTDPPGARVLCERYERRGLVWETVGAIGLGTTPLNEFSLPAGSYRLTLSADGRRDAVYPVLIERAGHWDSGPAAIPLLPRDAAGDDFLYVPAGPFIGGGDPHSMEIQPPKRRTLPGYLISKFPITTGEYCEFLNHLHTIDPALAVARAPRHSRGLSEAGVPYWTVPGPGERWAVPVEDADGDPWSDRWPVFNIDHEDARAYAAWRGERDGRPTGLPTEWQWAKATRGVDGRFFPWGDTFDASLCKCRASRPGRPQPEDVGAFPDDVSVYGVRDLAGGIREWCDGREFDGDPALRPIRGGSWLSAPRQTRPSNRYGVEPKALHGYLGFRLVRPLPIEGASTGPERVHDTGE